MFLFLFLIGVTSSPMNPDVCLFIWWMVGRSVGRTVTYFSNAAIGKHVSFFYTKYYYQKEMLEGNVLVLDETPEMNLLIVRILIGADWWSGKKGERFLGLHYMGTSTILLVKEKHLKMQWIKWQTTNLKISFKIITQNFKW